jgi:exodeoxyribonuclease VII small subunit
LIEDSQTAEAPFEELLASLEKTISLLADGTAPLDELVTAHQRAVSTLAEAQRRLDALKDRAELITRQLTE